MSTVEFKFGKLGIHLFAEGKASDIFCCLQSCKSNQDGECDVLHVRMTILGRTSNFPRPQTVHSACHVLAGTVSKHLLDL